MFIDNTGKNLLVAQELGIVPVMFDRDKEEYAGIKVNIFEELEQVIERHK